MQQLRKENDWELFAKSKANRRQKWRGLKTIDRLPEIEKNINLYI